MFRVKGENFFIFQIIVLQYYLKKLLLALLVALHKLWKNKTTHYLISILPNKINISSKIFLRFILVFYFITIYMNYDKLFKLQNSSNNIMRCYNIIFFACVFSVVLKILRKKFIFSFIINKYYLFVLLVQMCVKK